MQPGEAAHANHVAVAAHHRYGFEQVLALVAVHDNAPLGLQFPCPGVDIEHYHVHAKVHCGLLRAQPCAQAVVEENHHERLVLPKGLEFETVVLYLACLGECLSKVADVFYVDECSHVLSV